MSPLIGNVKLKIRQAILVINICLIALLGVVIIKAVLSLQKQRLPAAAQAQEKISEKLPSNQTPLSDIKDYRTIVKENIFRGLNKNIPLDPLANTNKATEKVKSLSRPLPEFELQGTVAGPNAIARAIIKNPQTNHTDVYKIGSIIGSARITAIEKNSVTLDYEGQKITLKPKVSAHNLPADRPANTPANPTEKAGNMPASLKHQLLEAIFENAKIEPYLVANQPRGLRISNLEKVENSQLLPLQDGDVIQLINGQVLSDKQKAFQVLKKARTQSILDVELLREGQVKKFSFPPK